MKIALLSIALLFLAGCSWTKIVSVSSTGEQGNGSEDDAAVSANGRYVAFHSSANNLVEDDTNREYDIFVHDAFDRTTTRVSVNSAGEETVGFNGKSSQPSISADGRYVAFVSSATNLVVDDTNLNSDIFMHDTLDGTTTRVNVNSAGDEADGRSDEPSISGDGRYVAFSSTAANLDLVSPVDTNGEWDIFVHDTDDGITTRVSVNNNGSHEPSISGDGRYVAFRSLGGQGAPDDNRAYDIYVHDTDDGTTIRASVNSAGEEAVGGIGLNGTAGLEPSISGDGRYVAFASSATNLVADDNNGKYDIFVHYMAEDGTTTTTRVSVNSAGDEAVGGSCEPKELCGSLGASISGDGRYVTFYSDASNLVADDTNGLPDVFVHDTVNGTTSRVSLNRHGEQSIGGGSYRPSISDDGRYVAFHTEAINLVKDGNDTNGQPDIVMRANLDVTVTSVMPNILPAGSTTSVVITGTDFRPGVLLTIAGADVSSVAVVDENTITAEVIVAADRPIGPKTVIVWVYGTGPGSKTGATAVCLACITVQ